MQYKTDFEKHLPFNFLGDAMRIFEIEYFENRVLWGKVELLVIDPEVKLTSYQEIHVKKRSGGTRKLNCIDKNSILYKCQRRLKENFFDRIPTSDLCYGYKKGLSYKDYLSPHIGNRFFLRIDIADFFGSINSELLTEVLDPYVKSLAIGDTTLLNLIVDVTTLEDKLPQGAITSPSLSNIVFRQLDIRIHKYCEKYQVIYSRYVDDLLFSSQKSILHEPFFMKSISNILASKGFSINRNKIIKTTEQISLSGFVTGSELRISRKKRKLLSTILYCFERYKPKTYKDLLVRVQIELGSTQIKKITYLHNFLSGYRALLIGWLPKDSLGNLIDPINRTDFDRKNLRLINSIETILKSLNP